MANLKLHFGKLLKKYIKDSGLRQFDIAETLNLSPSAVSQMLSGRMTPNLKQLDAILERLSLDRASSAELRDCLSRIRSGDENLRSPLNEFIKSNRVAKGLSVEQLANMTGIPEENLVMLENRLNVQPTPYEAVRLAAIFNCSISELCQVDVLEKTPVVYTPEQGSFRRQVHIMREPAAVYQAGKSSSVKTPVIQLEDLKHFSVESDSLMDFAWRHMRNVESDHAAGLVVVTAPGAEFGWSELYNVKLLIGESPQWIPGMTVLGYCDNELILARATAEKMSVVAMGDEKVCKCQFYWLVNSFSIESELFEQSRGNKKNQRNAAVMRARRDDNVDGDEQ